MILNTIAILLGLVDVLRLIFAGLSLGLGVLAFRASSRVSTTEGRTALENRCELLFLLTLLLLAFTLVSWPLLYALLQSFVVEWPGVMCIYGVTQIGQGSLGSSQHLPALLTFLQWSKPALALLGGAWFVIYRLNCQTRTAPLLRRLFILLVPFGLLTAADAVAELAYIAIPKKEEFPSGGCCTGAFESGIGTPFLSQRIFGDDYAQWVQVSYYASTLLLILVLGGVARTRNRAPGGFTLGLLWLGGTLVLCFSWLFLIDVAAPKLLGLPYHHCPYDLIPQAPEAILAIGLFLAGWLGLGWACVAGWWGRSPETKPFLPAAILQLLRFSLWGVLLSLMLMVMELALA